MTVRNRFRHTFRRISQPILWKIYRWYLSKPRWYRYAGLQIRVLPSVFHPGWLISTKVLLTFILEKEIKGKKVLELGAGSGMIALACARAGAQVMASDINPQAIAAIQESCKKNQLELETVLSDLFQAITPQHFDYILINPPYYPRDPVDDREKAFFCGADFEYFRALFAQLPSYISTTSQTLMILSEDCELEKIIALAQTQRIEMELVFQTKRQGEEQFIYQLTVLD